MSQENVDLVMGLQPAPDADLAQFFRDDAIWAAALEAFRPLFRPDVESAHRLLGAGQTYFGLDGLRAAWLDWMAPWASYRVEIEEAIDCGHQVLVLVYDFGRREGSAEEVRSNNAAVWTVRDGKVARAEFYVDRAWARRDAGLDDER